MLLSILLTEKPVEEQYINQRDKDFLFSLQEDNYRRQFTDALRIMLRLIVINMHTSLI